MRKTFPVHSYPWHIQDWTNSKVRLTASLPARSIYRELIDFCTAEGYVPADPYFMSRVAACTPEDIAKYWPEIEHKFQQDPNDNTKLTNKKALSIRKTIQSRKLKQSKANTGKRKETEGVTERVNLGSTLSQPRVNPPPPSPSPSPSPSLIKSSSPPTPQGGLFVSSDPLSSQENGTAKSQGVQPEKFDATTYFRDEFWPAVWRKVGKGDALKAFRRAAKSLEAAERITGSARTQGPILIDAAIKGKREALHPATWLNGGRFDDELTETKVEDEDPW